MYSEREREGKAQGWESWKWNGQNEKNQSDTHYSKRYKGENNHGFKRRESC